MYYVCPYAAFDCQIILSVKEFVTPIVYNTLTSPPYPILVSNDQAGSDTKFSAIRAAAATCFSVSSPFASMHLPGAYVSSFGSTSAGGIISSADSRPSCSAGGVTRSVSATSSRYSPLSGAQPRRRGKKASHNAPKQQCSLFDDITDPVLPCLLLIFLGLNLTINDRHPGRWYGPGKFPKLETIVPDPVVFVGPKDDGKRTVYLTKWRRFRSSWLSRCSAQLHPQAVTNAVWRKLLFLASSGAWPAGAKAVTSSECDHQEASNLLTDTLRNFPSSTPSNSSPPTDEEVKSMMHELSLVNLRFQLVALDLASNQSAPKPSASVLEVELQVSQLAHRRRREDLVAAVFGGSHDTFSIHETTFVRGFAAERWPDGVDALRALETLMWTWPGEKNGIWGRVNDPNLPKLPGPGMEWERVVPILLSILLSCIWISPGTTSPKDVIRCIMVHSPRCVVE
ncbi:hypothetical protein PM082_007842 [Marasmius tenuissimus]|nr:hypothetical protein PM082_007842 [Marasmius tenuissimus]